MTDYTDPDTIDIDIVIGGITHAHKIRGHTWTDRPAWPNVTVLALANEIKRLTDGIAEHRRQIIAGDFAYTDGQVLVDTDERLWALIEEGDHG